jgi:hypothetical protein
MGEIWTKFNFSGRNSNHDLPSGSDALLSFHGHCCAKAFDLEQLHQACSTGDACGADIFHGEDPAVAAEIKYFCMGMYEYISTM